MGWKSPMQNLDAAGFEELDEGYEVLVGGDEDGGVVVVDPGELDHVCGDADVDAFLLGAAHVWPHEGQTGTGVRQSGQWGGERFF